MSAIVIEDSLVHYEVIGRGRPVIFVHGWLGSWRYWMSTMEMLAGNYRTYAFDLWGFGDSDKPDNRYTVDDYVHLLVSFMDQLGIWRTPLVGHALGAVVAVRFATRYPDRVEKLMVVSLPVVGQAIGRSLRGASGSSALSRFLRQSPYPELTVEMEKIADDAVMQSVRSVSELDLREDIRRLRLPMLAVYGDKDNLVDSDQARLFPRREETIRPIVLGGTRHFPMLDEASKFNRLLMDFLDYSGSLHDLEIKEEWRRRTR